MIQAHENFIGSAKLFQYILQQEQDGQAIRIYKYLQTQGHVKMAYRCIKLSYCLVTESTQI